jgi:hypothetical protein
VVFFVVEHLEVERVVELLLQPGGRVGEDVSQLGQHVQQVWAGAAVSCLASASSSAVMMARSSSSSVNREMIRVRSAVMAAAFGLSRWARFSISRAWAFSAASVFRSRCRSAVVFFSRWAESWAAVAGI